MAEKKEQLIVNSLCILGLWAFLIILGSATGFIAEFTPSFIVPAVLIIFIVMLVPYFRDASIKRWVRGFGLRKLTAFQVWRIFAGLIFFTYFMNGELPEIFVCIAGWGGIAVGFLAALVAALPFNVMRYTAFHAIGLLELVVAVWLGATLMLNGVGEMNNILTLPASLIIFLGVPISAALHVFALDMMKKATIERK